MLHDAQAFPGTFQSVRHILSRTAKAFLDL